MNEDLLKFQVAQLKEENTQLKKDNKDMYNIVNQLLIEFKVMSKNIDTLANNQAKFDLSLESLKKEVQDIKEAPARDYKTIKMGIVTLIISTIIGFITYQLGLKK